ncbi:ATP-binding cassette permease MDL2 [Rhizophagus irregularis DAOM 197198w]|uniref:ATP-binding cassette permease MDL2 n=1 Tax=Rhizophagus irregularis (strain DAOM 197198w) TaxID=1432141 RepID=A0A015KDE1_RHIIW|nr:ATP-binding cassette permease MDL2 [Rhizophagus irregularis DAOM 197198w]
MPRTVLEVKNLTKKIAGKTILNDITFSLDEGEILGLLGKNGAGKTTTLKIIVGLVSKTSGTVYINNINTEKQFIESIKHVGAIIENPEMYGYLSGYKNLIHFARMSNCKISKSEIEKVVKLVGLETAINKKFKTYSLGMKQRLGIAQAIIHKPALLILDEPTNGLDPQGIYQLRGYLKELTKQGTSILISSHLLSEMQLLCDKLVIIDNGKILKSGSLDDLVNTNAEKLVEFSVNNPIKAKEIITGLFPTKKVTLDGYNVIIKIDSDNIALINQEFVKNEVVVTGIVTKQNTLEEQFLDLTREE